jgi:hypothetical protein
MIDSHFAFFHGNLLLEGLEFRVNLLGAEHEASNELWSSLLLSSTVSALNRALTRYPA